MEQEASSPNAALLHDDTYTYTANGDKSPEKSTLKSVTSYIIVTEFCERLAYYGFAGSLVLFFQRRLAMGNAEADTMVKCRDAVRDFPPPFVPRLKYAFRVPPIIAVQHLVWGLLHLPVARWLHCRQVFGTIQNHSHFLHHLRWGSRDGCVQLDSRKSGACNDLSCNVHCSCRYWWYQT